MAHALVIRWFTSFLKTDFLISVSSYILFLQLESLRHSIWSSIQYSRNSISSSVSNLKCFTFTSDYRCIITHIRTCCNDCFCAVSRTSI